MNVFVALIAGVIIGWFIEWVIDWLFWRQDDSPLKEQLRATEADLQQAQNQLSDNAQQLKLLDSARQETLQLRGELQQANVTLDALAAENTTCQTELDALKQKLGVAEAELSHAQAQLTDAGQTIDDLRARLEELMVPAAPQEEDMLERVKGIGAVFAGRLKAAGVRTFAQLAQLTPERVEEIINPEEWQKIEPVSWISQAVELAAKKAAKSNQ